MSEEIFDFSKNRMMKAKVQELKQSLNSEFGEILNLCHYVLNNSQKPSLVQVCPVNVNTGKFEIKRRRCRH